MALNNQQRGFFVDVGAGCDDPRQGSNSLVFEERGWDGVAIDADPLRMQGRKCNCVAAFLGEEEKGANSLGQVLKGTVTPSLVDYLSVDLEGEDFNAIKSFHEHGYRFKVATVEHNLYSRNPGVDDLKKNIYEYLTSLGYLRVVDNAGNRAVLGDLQRGWPFEDWYVDPAHVDSKRLLTNLALGRR